MTNDERWLSNFNELKAYILERGHLPNKHVVEKRALLSWAKYQRKKIKDKSLDEDKMTMFLELMDRRSHEHTGGRKKKNDKTNESLS